MGCALIDCGEGHAHICGSGIKSCSFCGFVSDYQCDWPMGNGKTCNAHLCERHAIAQGRLPSNQLVLFDTSEPAESDIHFCPTHELMAKRGIIPAKRSTKA